MLVSELIASLEMMEEIVGDIPIVLSILDHEKIEDHTKIFVASLPTRGTEEEHITIQNF